MRKLLLLVTTVAVALSGAAQSQTNDFATGNMHFDSTAIATDSNHMITKEAMTAYGERMGLLMSKGAATIPDQDADRAFERGNLKFDATDMDTDHDGSVSRAEFMAFAGRRFDQARGTHTSISESDASKYFARGNTRPGG
jgi:hypothetical protein